MSYYSSSRSISVLTVLYIIIQFYPALSFLSESPRIVSLANFNNQQPWMISIKNKHNPAPIHQFLKISPPSTTSTSLTRTSSLISSKDLWGNIAILCSTAALSQTLGETTKIGKLLGAPVTAMAIAFLLGSIGILPSGGSQGCKVLQSFSLYLATPLILLGTDLRGVRNRCGPLFIAFLMASFATLMSSIVAYATFSKKSRLYRALGKDGLKIVAALLAKNIGGGINYISVCQTLKASPNAIAAGLCVDNIFALIYFPATSLLASKRPDVDGHILMRNEDNGVSSSKSLQLRTFSNVIAFATVVTWLSKLFGKQWNAELPMSTILTLCFTTIAPQFILKEFRPVGELLGTCLLFLFFATAGAPGIAIADSVRNSFLPLSIFLSGLYVGHAMILFFFHQCFKNHKSMKNAVQPQRLLVASSAAIGGPATAVALAKSNEWNSLVAPGILVGNFGYAIATFIGLIFHALFQ